jgi:two-component system sensor histidine kinase KdpD
VTGARRRRSQSADGATPTDAPDASDAVVVDARAGLVPRDRPDRRNRLQREFLRGVAHNLRAPLATIELAASDLLDAHSDPVVRSRAEAILVEERRIARILGQILLVARMDSGALELDGEPVALGPLARRVADELGLASRVTIEEHADGAVAISDEAATEQLLWILLDNAARYAPDGPIRVEIRGAGTAAEPRIVLAVADDGPGVAPGDERRIFRRFARGGSAEGTAGSGVGLSVARGLARALGGDVAYRRTPRGARFEVTMPSSGPAADAEL